LNSIHSMTGYAAATANLARGALSLELRGVNARFLDLQFRVAEELRGAEPALRELLGTRIARGKVDCRIAWGSRAAAPGAQALNAAAVQALGRLAGEARRIFPDAAPLRVADVLRWPGVIDEAPQDEGALAAAALGCAESALRDFNAARAREGAKLAQMIVARVAQMEGRITALLPLLPEAVAAYQAKLAQRLREALGTADDERVRAEIAVFAMKSDVDEELTRLAAHLAEVKRVLAQGGPVGKRLDFLAQELNREANTVASKAAGAKIGDTALELKLLIEQIREQVQNIE
jgi:uncharacterized protein (TIGR00255 family)